MRLATNPYCPVCNNAGRYAYEELHDGLFAIPGAWNIRACDDPACGMLWLDPHPAEEDIHKAYEGYYTHGNVRRRKKKGLRGLWKRLVNRPIKYFLSFPANAYKGVMYNDPLFVSATTNSWMSPFMRLRPSDRADIDFSYMYLPVIPGARLLEVGCGSGWMLSLMQQRGWIAEGIDFDPKAVAHARTQGLEVHVGDLSAQMYPLDYFDVITCSHVIEHLYDPTNFLIECKRVLKPKGRLVIVTPNSESLGRVVFGRHWRGLEPPRHLQIFSANGLKVLAGRAGFAECQIRYSIRDAHNLFNASKNLAVTGRHEHGQEAAFHWRFLFRAMQLFERFVMCWKPSVGEELVIILTK